MAEPLSAGLEVMDSQKWVVAPALVFAAEGAFAAEEVEQRILVPAPLDFA